MSNTLKNIFEISYIILLYCYIAMLVDCLSLRVCGWWTFIQTSSRDWAVHQYMGRLAFEPIQSMPSSSDPKKRPLAAKVLRQDEYFCTQLNPQVVELKMKGINDVGNTDEFILSFNWFLFYLLITERRGVDCFVPLWGIIRRSIHHLFPSNGGRRGG